MSDYLQITSAENTEVAESPHMVSLISDMMAEIATIERDLKIAKQRKDELSAILLEQMEKRNIIKFESDQVCINYIAETDRETFNSKKFRSDNPDLYDKYVDIKPVKANVRVKIKGEK